MKDFYKEREPQYSGNLEEDEVKKREKVLEVIKPICEVFGIKDYDYLIDRKKGKERLVVEGQAIGCMCNSIGATVMELINYIWLQTYAENRSLGAFEAQTKKRLKNYWIED